MNIRHILLATDLSPEALRPCAPIAALARRVGARITLLHVVQDLRIAPHGAPLAPALSTIDLEKEREIARASLQEQKATLGADVEIALEVITGTDTAQAIADCAKRTGVDLIALSTHGRTGFRHLALGSVAEAVLRRSPVPVIVFPRPKD